MLKVENLKVRYGMIEAIKGISFEIHDGEIVALIGANGAGKTTTMHAISGLLKPAEGTITLDDVDLVKTPSNKIVSMGLAQVPEGRRVFAQQTVAENLALGAYSRKDKEQIQKDLEHAQDIVEVAKSIKEKDGDKWLNKAADVWMEYFKDEGIEMKLDAIRKDLDLFRVHFDVWTHGTISGEGTDAQLRQNNPLYTSIADSQMGGALFD